MMTIRRASFRQVLERGGRRYAEVEVETDRRANPQLLAYFRREGNGRYQLVRVIGGEEDSEPEGMGSGLHSAAEADVATQLFGGPSHGGEEDRARFGHRIIEFGDVREQLDRNL